MIQIIAGLIVLLLGVKLFAGFAFLSTQFADKFLPKNTQARRFAPVILTLAIIAISHLIANSSMISFWWIVISFLCLTGFVGILRIYSLERAELAANQLKALKNIQRAKDIYQQYETSPSLLNNPSFYAEFKQHWNWSRIRADVISAWRQGDKRCNGCGTLIRGKRIHVDHIKPRSKHPNIRYLKSNLQVLCDRCNIHKNDYDGDDWREVVVARKKAHEKRRRIRSKRKNFTNE
ncbi:HNH endonuclease signature motif containing protein [uncultured Aquitalea sp.]|uniref:HNH endonuclease n=1 Tax=uncultured Aquitalea sp. TaxID=540272 RepID=UPI0025D8C073|nr:HNH endonuclease signature motif containing protein [uncultured Aquitalea sp.]